MPPNGDEKKTTTGGTHVSGVSEHTLYNTQVLTQTYATCTHHTSHSPHPTSHIPHPTSYITHIPQPTSHITYHTSHIVHPTSHIPTHPHTSHITQHTSHTHTDAHIRKILTFGAARVNVLLDPRWDDNSFSALRLLLVAQHLSGARAAALVQRREFLRR
jgi:hypothetical protein